MPATAGRTAVGRTLISLGMAMLAAGLVVGIHMVENVSNLDVLATLEGRLIDLRFRIRGPRPPSGEVVIVAIDSKSTEALGRWPWSRHTHAQLIDRLRDWGASAVAFDVLFQEPQGVEETRRLERILAELPDGSIDPVVGAARRVAREALGEVEADEALGAAMDRALDDDSALVVLGFDFVFPEDVVLSGKLGVVLTEMDEQAVLDFGSFATRDENVAVMRNEPPQLGFGIRPVLPRLTESCAALGFVNPSIDQDGLIRRERMLVVFSPVVRKAFESEADVRQALLDPEANVQAFMPLSVAAVATHRRLKISQVVLDLAGSELRLPSEDDPEIFTAFPFDPIDGTMRIDFLGGARTIPTYSFSDTISGRPVDANGDPIDGRDAFAGKLVFVGMSDPGLSDFFATPFTARLPGVEKHANTAENLLAGHALREHRDPELVVMLTSFGAAILVALVAGNLSPLFAFPILFVLFGAGIASSYNDFVNEGLLWNWTLPSLSLFLGSAAVVAYRQVSEARARREMENRSEFIQATFGRYLSQDVVARLIDSPEGLKLGGDKKRITILMSDLRGFTALCERSEPGVVIDMLNFYLGTMADIVMKHGGTVDEFIGDAILALFGAPERHPDDAQRAVTCAVEMQLAMADVNRKCRESGLPEVEMGIAVNTGEVVVGNIGSEKRSKYGVVGSHVNLTSRIESHTVGGQILISGDTLAEAGDAVEVGERIDVTAKGLAEPVPAYYVLGIRGRDDLRLEQVRLKLVTLQNPFPVRLAVLEGKHVSDESHDGRLVRLSGIGGEIESSSHLAPLTNIRIHVLGEDGARLEGDLYAKIVESRDAEGCLAVRFTSTPSAVRRVFDAALSDLQA